MNGVAIARGEREEKRLAKWVAVVGSNRLLRRSWERLEWLRIGRRPWLLRAEAEKEEEQEREDGAGNRGNRIEGGRKEKNNLLLQAREERRRAAPSIFVVSRLSGV